MQALLKKVRAGKVTLKRDDDHGYLASLLKALDVRITWSQAFVLNMVGSFYNTFMPGSTMPSSGGVSPTLARSST